MRIVVFHRKESVLPIADIDPWSTGNYSWNGQAFSRKQLRHLKEALLEPFSEQAFEVIQPEKDLLHLHCNFKFYGVLEDQTIQMRLPQWTYYSFWYRSGLRRIDVINEDFNRQNAMVAGLQHELADVAGAVGRILILDDVALLYLRGRIQDVKDVENVIVQPGEHSTWAYARYSSKAQAFLDEIQRKRDETQTYSLQDKVARLECEIEELKTRLKLLGADQ